MLHSISRDKDGDAVSLSLFPPDGAPVVATPGQQGFDRAVWLVQQGQYQQAIDVLRPAQAIESAWERWKNKILDRGAERLATDVKIDRFGTVTVDGVNAPAAISQTILRYYREGSKEDFLPLVRFLQNINDNPNAHSREQLYDWLEHQSFTITQDGCFIGYKSVTKDASGRFVSTTTSREGDNVVAGGTKVPAGERVPYAIGSHVQMPREVVNHDPSQGCSTGLHVGTWGYASRFSGNWVLSVKVNPAHVASVPTDCGAEKVRVSELDVIGVSEKERVRALSRIGAES